uniref:Uncharacterized protein n=1 Tax=Trichuris muris TaxID=70415 RepID=A0A5S6QHX0_TRIMR
MRRVGQISAQRCPGCEQLTQEEATGQLKLLHFPNGAHLPASRMNTTTAGLWKKLHQLSCTTALSPSDQTLPDEPAALKLRLG